MYVCVSACVRGVCTLFISFVNFAAFFEPSSSVTITITEEISIGKSTCFYLHAFINISTIVIVGTVVLELPGYCGTISNWLKPLSYNVQISPSTYFNWNSTVEAIVVAGRLDRDVSVCVVSRCCCCDIKYIHSLLICVGTTTQTFCIRVMVMMQSCNSTIKGGM